MKGRKGLILNAIFCLAMSPAIGQETETPSRTILKQSPQHFVGKALKVGLERFNRDHSGSVAVFVTGVLNRNDQNTYLHDQYDGLAGEFQLRKYISPLKLHTTRKDKAYHRGMYLAAYAQAGTYSGYFIDAMTNGYIYSKSIRNYGLGFTFGYQRTIWKVAFLEAFVGGGIQSANTNCSGDCYPRSFIVPSLLEPEYSGIFPKAGLLVGVGL